VKLTIGLICSLALSLATASLGFGQSSTDQGSAPPKETARKVKKSQGPGKEMGEGGKDIGKGAAKGSTDLAKGVGGGAGKLARGHVSSAGASVGKGGAGFGKNVGVGTAKGTAKVGKGIGGEFKKLGKDSSKKEEKRTQP
jgi:hypothetical protein